MALRVQSCGGALPGRGSAGMHAGSRDGAPLAAPLPRPGPVLRPCTGLHSCSPQPQVQVAFLACDKAAGLAGKPAADSGAFLPSLSSRTP